MSEPTPFPCHDATCEQHADCMLFCEPSDPRWRGFSLFPYDLPIDQPCPWFADREAA